MDPPPNQQTETIFDQEAGSVVQLTPGVEDRHGTISTFVTISSLVFVLYSQFVDFSPGSWLVFFGAQGLLVARFRLLDKSPTHTLLPGVVDPVNMRLMLYDRDFDARDYETLLALDGDNPFGAQRAARAGQVESLPRTVICSMPSPSKAELNHTEADTSDDSENSMEIRECELASPEETSSIASSLTLLSCCICLDEFAIGHVVKTLPCAHQFHADCVDQWLRLHAVCPICKRPLPRL